MSSIVCYLTGLSHVDPVKNAHRARPPRYPESAAPRQLVSFDPSCTTADMDVSEEDLDALF